MENQQPGSGQPKPSMDGVVDELRNVLANLGHTPPPVPPAPEAVPSPVPDPSPMFSPIEPFASSQQPPASPPPPFGDNGKDTSPSDTDFWKGNVLGWPSQESLGEPLPPPPTPSKMTPSPEPTFEKPALEGSPFSLDKGFIDELPPEPQRSPTPPVPPAGTPPLGAAPWELEPTLPDLPEAPAPAHDYERIPPAMDTPQEEAFPIPQNIGAKTPAPLASQKPKDDDLELEGSQLKPEGLVQVACLFPEGQERPAQQFVTRLRELSEKSNDAKKIQSVFVSSWSSGQIDMKAWMKSAQLSGADIMFILVFKKDAELFKSHKANPALDNVKVRFVTMEQLALRTLYSDILIELKRGR